MLGILYGELTKNLEMTKFSLSQQEPLIEIIDPSVRPLNKTGKGRVKSGFFWGLISSFSILFYLSIKKLISILK
jgi:hypothetical protein